MRSEQGREEDTIVSRLIVALVGLACRFPRTTLAAALVLCGLSAYASANFLTFRTQRDDLVSPRKDYQERWRQFVREFGDEGDMVVVVEGKQRAEMERTLEALAAQVKGRPDLFDRLFYKVDLRNLRDRALLFLPAEQIRQIQDNLKSMNLLLEPPLTWLDPLIGWKSLTVGHLLGEAEQRLQSGGDRSLRAGDQQLLAQLTAVCNSAEAALADPARYKSPWGSMLPPPQQKDLLAEPQYFFSEDGTLAFLLVRPVKDAGSFTMAEKSIAELRRVAAEVGGRFPGIRVGLTGLPVLENDETAASQHDSGLASWLSLAGVVLVYLLVFRSPRYPLLSIGALLVAMAWAMGWLTVTVGHLNLLSATFAAMLLGMGDYGVLWVTRYEQERAAGADVTRAMRRTAAGVGPSIFTGATTTAIAFFVATLVDFQAVAELGWIAGWGVYFCVLAVFTVLPAALRLSDRREEVPAAAALPLRPGGQWLPALMRRPGRVVAAGLAVTAVLAVCATRVSYDHNLLHLQAESLDSVQWELKLIEHTAGASWHVLSYTSTPEEAMELKHRFEQLPVVQRVVTAADMVPLEQERKLEQLRDIQARLRRLPPRGALLPRPAPNAADVRARLAGVLAALSPGAGPSSPLTAELAAGLRRLQARLDALPPAEAARRLRDVEQLMARDLAEDLYRLREVSTPEPIALGDLPPSLRERYIGKHGKWLLQVFGKECLWEFAPLQHFVEQVHSVDPDATGKPFSTLAGLVAMKRGFETSAWLALAAMVIVLLLDLRNVGYTLLALAPLLLGITCAVGVLALVGLPLNPANMLAFPLILGVGADNGVLVVKDYRQQRRRLYSLSLPMGRGVLVVGLTTVLGFGSLMISRHRGLASLGLVLVIGVTCCMVTALVFLPAVLRLLSLRKQPPPAAVAPPRPVQVVEAKLYQRAA